MPKKVCLGKMLRPEGDPGVSGRLQRVIFGRLGDFGYAFEMPALTIVSTKCSVHSSGAFRYSPIQV